MGYIVKDTSPLINTKLTDAARMKISQGKFNISYFQIGDSEVDYNVTTDIGNNFNILRGQNNYQNLYESNKSSIKYPLSITETDTNSFGIPFQNSTVEQINNTTEPSGFFNNGLRLENEVTKNPNFVVNLSSINGGNVLNLTSDVIESDSNENISSGDFAVVFFDTDISNFNKNVPVLIYKIVSGNNSSITLDRDLPNFSSYSGIARVVIYPGEMIPKYDSENPQVFWNENTMTFEGICDTSLFYSRIWNMNIAWSELPAGVTSSNSSIGSKEFLGTKEYLGYTSDSGQTENNETYFINSFNETINVLPSEQKSIAIVHYTNNSIEEIYGEKFSMEEDITSNKFKVHLPWIMWHKSDSNTLGETFYVDPPNHDLFQVKYIKSSVNDNMNEPGIRYYHLWDNNTTPNRVGKVFPDLKIIVFDDDELIAVMSNKSNRNFTLPSPKLGLVAPNTFNGVPSSQNGLLDTTDETLWVTYRLEDTNHNYLHCNYYNKITGTDTNCEPDTSNITVKFGSEFNFMSGGTSVEGFKAQKIYMLAQKVQTGNRPNPSLWKQIEVTNQIDGDLDSTTLVNTTFQITKENYESASNYNLNNYINLNGDFNFGDEYFFYGTIETDIQATIYVMNYLCNLSSTQFLKSNNPTWNSGEDIYVSEIGLYDDEKDLMIISKLQTPQRRVGVQQYSIKLDI